MLHLLRVEMVIDSPWMLSTNWLVQKQTDFGKDISNPFMADNLPKIVGFSTHHVTFMKSWLVQKQTALGVNTPRSDEDRLKLMELMVFLLQKGNTASVKHSDDVTRLQALVDRKKIMISEVFIPEILQLDDAEGVVCLPNKEIFAGLAQMGYEKPSTKLTFYKAFFSSQWKFFIHTLLQSLKAKRTSWNEFSTTMASAVICLSKGQKFNFLKYIFDSLVCNLDSSLKFYMYPWFIQLIIQNQIGDLSTHNTSYISPTLTQKVFANMRQVGKGFSGVETPLFEGMLAARQVAEEGIAEEQVQANDAVAAAVQENIAEDVANDAIPSTPTPFILPSPPSHDIPFNSQEQSSPPQQPQRTPQAPPQGAEFPTYLFQQVLDTCSANLEHDKAVLSIQEDDLEVQEVVEVVTTAKLLTDVVTAATSQVSAASATISAAKPRKC
nr:hypothetical protein [Tanacetum cinerariifolium]